MNDLVSIRLYPAKGYKIDIAPFIIVADELFPTIISTKYQPRNAGDIRLELKDRKKSKKKHRYNGVYDLLVTVSLSHDTEPAEVDTDTIVAQQLAKGLFDVLGTAVDLELVLIANKEEVAWITSDDLAADVLPELEADPVLTEALDRVFKRLIAEDPNLDLDASTGIIRVLAGEQLELAPA